MWGLYKIKKNEGVDPKKLGEKLEVIFNKMNKHGVARYSDNECTVTIDPTGKMFERMREGDSRALFNNRNPFGESR